MSHLTALQQFVCELEAGHVSLAEVTETTLVSLPLTSRERAIILSGQERVIRLVASGEACIHEVRLELTPENSLKVMA